MAHNQFRILELLMQQLDDERNDLYIHIDKKSKGFKLEEFSDICKKSKVVFIPRMKTYWGHESLVECELRLLECALQSENHYEYFHLLSGVDLQIKTNDEVHAFFDQHPNMQFLALRNPLSGINGLNRYYYFLWIRTYNKYISRGLDIISEFVQRKIFHVNRLKNADFGIAKAQQWFSITEGFAEYVIHQREFINKLIKYTSCSDEMFLATVLINSPFKDQLFLGYDRTGNHVRLIDRVRNEGASPHTWRINDWDIILQCPYFWARKFNENIDREIIDRVFETWHT